MSQDPKEMFRRWEIDDRNNASKKRVEQKQSNEKVKAVIFIAIVGIAILYFLLNIPKPFENIDQYDEQQWNNDDTENYIEYKQHQNELNGEDNTWYDE